MLDSIFRNMTPVVKNILLLNILMFLAQNLFPQYTQNLELYPIVSENFKPWQLATHFFMHANMMHIFFNMLIVVMFGVPLERIWGPQKFLKYYLITAMGAAGLHLLVGYLRFLSLSQNLPEDVVYQVLHEGVTLLPNGQNYIDPNLAYLNIVANVPVIGASGAVFGLLVAFGYLFPNTQLFLLFPPVPIKAKYFVLAYTLIELWLGFANNPHDNVAHFAHLGGAIAGFILLVIWQRNKTSFY